MSRGRQQGILLLPVTLTLAVIGALAYAMTRDGSMNVAAIDAQYDADVARYLAASGVQLAKWRTAKDKCNNGAQANFGTLALPGGTVAVNTTSWSNGSLTVGLTATTTGAGAGAVHASTRKVRVHNLGDPKQKILMGDGDDDITIMRTSPAGLASAETLEATDGTAHPLVYFDLPGEFDKALIVQADLKLTKQWSNSTQANRSLGIHRITTDWTSNNVTWSTPWTAPGGDYVAAAAASMTIDPNAPTQFNGVYTASIAVLVEQWAAGTVRNYGLLLKPTHLVNTTFTSFDGSSKPELDVGYYLPCS